MNNDLDFGRALDIIKRDNKNRPLVGCCGNNVGPTGPTGPTGPSFMGSAKSDLICRSKD